jgi:hypothetical protein
MARSGSVFLVNLAGLDLPKSALDELEKEIDAVVDRKIASLAKFKGKVASAPLGPEIRGKYVLLKEFQGAFGG